MDIPTTNELAMPDEEEAFAGDISLDDVEMGEPFDAGDPLDESMENLPAHPQVSVKWCWETDSKNIAIDKIWSDVAALRQTMFLWKLDWSFLKELIFRHKNHVINVCMVKL